MTVNIRQILYMCGWIILLVAGSFLLPLIPALYYGDGTAASFLICAGIGGALALALLLPGRFQANREVRNRESLAVVGVAWLMIGFLGGLPYWISGVTPDFWDGLFESFSGFSTTGATIFSDLEMLPAGILFWRVLTHWLGGMGIIVLMLAILPFLGLGGMQLFKNEVPGPGMDKLRPRIAETAKYLWGIYLGLTAVLFLLLLAGGLSAFEAICHAFSTIATGGFANRDLSIGYYGSAYVEIVLTIFMIACATNFTLHYQALTGNVKALVQNAEFRFFIGVVALATALAAGPLLLGDFYSNPLTALRHSFFQVVAVITTTGFGTADWELWPSFSQTVLMLLFFVGGCSGSTSGGFKCVRWLILFKSVHRALRLYTHPRAVMPIKLGGKVVAENLVQGVWIFFILYILALGASTLILAGMDLDLLTAFTASASSLGNVGPGLGQVGPAETYALLPGPAKGVLSFNMFLGRLEFFSLLVLFLPEFWKK